MMVTWSSVWKCSSHIVLRLFISSQYRVVCLPFLIDSCPRLQVNKDVSIFSCNWSIFIFHTPWSHLSSLLYPPPTQGRHCLTFGYWWRPNPYLYRWAQQLDISIVKTRMRVQKKKMCVLKKYRSGRVTGVHCKVRLPCFIFSAWGQV